MAFNLLILVSEKNWNYEHDCILNFFLSVMRIDKFSCTEMKS